MLNRRSHLADASGPASEDDLLPAVAVRAKTVAIIGGTGPAGRGLALRFAAAGLKVVIGSRVETRARACADALTRDAGGTIKGLQNAAAATAGDIVIIAVPWESHRRILVDLYESLVGKVVVDCVNPLGFDKRGAYALRVAEGSAAQQAAALLPASRVTAAFHHVSASHLEDPALEMLDTDVMVLGDDPEATALVRALVETIPGMRGVPAGRLRDAHQVEALSANLIAVNRGSRAHSGLRITDLESMGPTASQQRRA